MVFLVLATFSTSIIFSAAIGTFSLLNQFVKMIPLLGNLAVAFIDVTFLQLQEEEADKSAQSMAHGNFCCLSFCTFWFCL